MEIPIQNIYYLLCYSWDKLEEKDIVSVDATMFNNVLDLFAQVLINGCTHLFKKGLDRSYIEVEEPIKGIKGKIEFSESLKQNLFSKVHVYCLFHELHYDVLHNQILKSTLHRLIRTPELDKKIKEGVTTIYRKFEGISSIKITSHDFDRVTLHRNNFFYHFLLQICQIIHDYILITEDEGKYKFKSFLRDEKKMQLVFQNFVKNFYKKEQKKYWVKGEHIYWNAQPLDDGTLDRLPRMETDISLYGAKRKIVIDTKYYKEALKKRYDTEKLHSGNLYQMFTYLKNLAAKGGVNANCEGVLLYPTVNYELNEAYQIDNHKLSIRTVDLDRHWVDIKTRLLSIIR